MLLVAVAMLKENVDSVASTMIKLAVVAIYRLRQKSYGNSDDDDAKDVDDEMVEQLKTQNDENADTEINVNQDALALVERCHDKLEYRTSGNQLGCVHIVLFRTLLASPRRKKQA
jgi:hypothetical protein